MSTANSRAGAGWVAFSVGWADTRTGGLEVLFLGGQPIGETVAWAVLFVMNTEAELRQAYEDFHAGKLGVVPPNHPLAPSDEVAEGTDSALD